MANEIRRWANWVGGLVEDNPLASTATTLNSAGLEDLPAVDSTEHMLIVFDPDALTGAPFAKRVTAHTASAGSATIEAAAVIGTARSINQGTPWVHSFTTQDINRLLYAYPTGTPTRSSSTLGALSTPWTQAITLSHADQIVEFDLTSSIQVSPSQRVHVALMRGSTLIARGARYLSTDIEESMHLCGVDAPGSVGPHTYEVYAASSSGSTIYLAGSPTSTLATADNHDGTNILRLRTGWRTG